MSSRDASRQSAFGSLLRQWRDHTPPSTVGLAAAGRRTPGLRREELAALAGLSVDYLVQLDQGRASHPSPQTVEALVRALGLSAENAAVLHRAAGLTPARSAVPRRIPLGVARLVGRLDDVPVAVYTADWWLTTWNPAWTALLGDPADLAGRDRNLVWHEFTGAASRIVLDDAERPAFRDALVADLQLAAVEYPDVALRDLVADLRQASTDFASRWDAARPSRHATMRKRVAHPTAGILVLDSDVLHTSFDGLRIVVYSAEPGTADADRLALLNGRATEIGRGTELVQP